MSPIDRTRHIDIRYFAIQDWCEDGDIIMKHIARIINPSDDFTKPFGYILNSCHFHRIIRHHNSNY